MSETTQQIYSASALAGAIEQLGKGLNSEYAGRADVGLVGVRTRGVVLAERLAPLVGLSLPMGVIDINLYRDDYGLRGVQPEIRSTDIGFDVNGKTILLVDDVLFTGRTTRSALSAIMDFGRPEAIRLVVLVDRGGRELPIHPDYAAFKIRVEADQMVRLHLVETDGVDEVVLEPR